MFKCHAVDSNTDNGYDCDNDDNDDDVITATDT